MKAHYEAATRTLSVWMTSHRNTMTSTAWNIADRQTVVIDIGVNPAGDAGDVSPPIFWLVGTSMGMSPPIFGVASGIRASNRQCEKKATLSFKK